LRFSKLRSCSSFLKPATSPGRIRGGAASELSGHARRIASNIAKLPEQLAGTA